MNSIEAIDGYFEEKLTKYLADLNAPIGLTIVMTGGITVAGYFDTASKPSLKSGVVEVTNAELCIPGTPPRRVWTWHCRIETIVGYSEGLEREPEEGGVGAGNSCIPPPH